MKRVITMPELYYTTGGSIMQSNFLNISDFRQNLIDRLSKQEYTRTREQEYTRTRAPDDEGGITMKIIAISSQKGGVGKTTTATALAYGLKLLGRKVLLVDCDPQGNSSDTYRASTAEGSPTLADLLFTDEAPLDCIQHTEAGDIIAGDPLLRESDKYLKGVSGFYRMKNRLAVLSPHYDHIILDTNPNLMVLLQNALIAAEGVIVPVTCGRYALQGMNEFIETVNDVRDQPNPDLEILGLLLVKYDGRTILSREIESGLPAVAETLGAPVFATRIRPTIQVEEAQAARMPLQEYSPSCTAAEDYTAFVNELIEWRVV